ncbi:MAG: hypothetical protein ACI81P_002382 [Neolewinella sp.]|jgi:hypothetical protein
MIQRFPSLESAVVNQQVQLFCTGNSELGMYRNSVFELSVYLLFAYSTASELDTARV